MSGIINISNELSWSSSASMQEMILAGTLEHIKEPDNNVYNTIKDSLQKSPFMFLDLYAENCKWNLNDYDVFINGLCCCMNQCKNSDAKCHLDLSDEIFTHLNTLIGMVKQRRDEIDKVTLLSQQTKSIMLRNFVMEFDRCCHLCYQFLDLCNISNNFWYSSMMKRDYSLSQLGHDYLSYSIALPPWFEDKTDFISSCEFIRNEYISTVSAIIKECLTLCKESQQREIGTRLQKLLELWNRCLIEREERDTSKVWQGTFK